MKHHRHDPGKRFVSIEQDSSLQYFVCETIKTKCATFQKCNFCGSTYRYKFNLTNHVRRKHPNDCKIGNCEKIKLVSSTRMSSITYCAASFLCAIFFFRFVLYVIALTRVDRRWYCIYGSSIHPRYRSPQIMTEYRKRLVYLKCDVF